jgi:hypothetical protein
MACDLGSWQCLSDCKFISDGAHKPCQQKERSVESRQGSAVAMWMRGWVEISRECRYRGVKFRDNHDRQTRPQCRTHTMRRHHCDFSAVHHRKAVDGSSQHCRFRRLPLDLLPHRPPQFQSGDDAFAHCSVHPTTVKN